MVIIEAYSFFGRPADLPDPDGRPGVRAQPQAPLEDTTKAACVARGASAQSTAAAFIAECSSTGPTRLSVLTRTQPASSPRAVAAITWTTTNPVGT